MTWENYYMPLTTGEAIELLVEKQGKARIIAGGTDLMVQHRSDPLNVRALIDIGRIPGLKEIREDSGRIYIGASVTHSQIVNSGLLKKKGRVLVEAARTVGAPQIRNVGTVGGNVVNAQPAADTAIALTALDARIHILSGDGEFEKPVIDTFLGPGKSCIDPSKELVTAFSYPIPGPGERSCFARLARRESLALPIVNLGLWLCLEEDDHILKDIRIAVGPMSTVPFRARETEALLKGVLLDKAVIEKAGQSISDEVTPRDSFRGSADFKKQMIGVILKRSLESALEGKGVDSDEREQ